jgi:hypothetical protein
MNINNGNGNKLIQIKKKYHNWKANAYFFVRFYKKQHDNRRYLHKRKQMNFVCSHVS